MGKEDEKQNDSNENPKNPKLIESDKGLTPRDGKKIHFSKNYAELVNALTRKIIKNDSN